ncbi:hypothetical protein D9M69_543970 [compost metagenome]
MVVVAGEHQLEAPRQHVHLAQQPEGLTAQRNQVRGAHLGAALGVLHPLDSLALARDRPEAALHVDLSPAGEAQLTGANEHQQRQ